MSCRCFLRRWFRQSIATFDNSYDKEISPNVQARSTSPNILKIQNWVGGMLGILKSGENL